MKALRVAISLAYAPGPGAQGLSCSKLVYKLQERPNSGALEALRRGSALRNRATLRGLEMLRMRRFLCGRFTSVQLVAAAAPLLEGGDVVQCGLADGTERLAREERLVRGHEDVRERQEPRKHVVLDYVRREILEE